MAPDHHTNGSSAPIAIIGMGCLFAKSPGLKGYWRLLYQGIDGISEVPATHWRLEDYYDDNPHRPDHINCKRGGFLYPVSFDPTEFGIPPSILEATDSSQLLALMGAQMALQDAGYGKDKNYDRERTSVILGVTGTQELVIPLGARLGHPIWRRALESAQVPAAQANEVMQKISAAYAGWQENSFPGLLGNVVAGRISNRFDLGGTNCVVDAACASSLGAIHLAAMELASGHSDMVLTGGVDTLNDIFMHMCFSKTLVLSRTGDARPFAKDADGTVLGEGVGILILKRLADAHRDNDRIYALIKGIGSSSDGKSQSIYAPRIEGQVKALQIAYANAGLNPNTVELIEAHGTGTRVGDKIEFQALAKFFETSRPSNRSDNNPCALGSVKSMVGHTKAAAGSAGLIKAVLALHNKVLPPTLKIDTPDPDLDIDSSPFYLSARTRPWFSKPSHPRRAGVSAFGFGGSNFHVVLEEYSPQKPADSAWDGSVQIFAYSSRMPADLIQRLIELKRTLPQDLSDAELAFRAAKSRADFCSEDPARVLFICRKPLNPDNNATVFSKLLTQAVDVLQTHKNNTFQRRADIFAARAFVPGKMAFMFPGQGSQYVGMGHDLICFFPETFNVLETANSRFTGPLRLTDYVYPPFTENKAERSLQIERLTDTTIAQPAIGAVSAAMLKVLERFSVRPDAVCGHSFGELSALYAAGWFDLNSFLDISIARGECMAANSRTKGIDAGAMLAVQAPIEQIESLTHSLGTNICLANRNSPHQGVLSGETQIIRQAEEVCRQKGLPSVRLPVSAAFHSTLVREARHDFSKILDTIAFTPSKTPVIANTTGVPYPADVESAKQLLGQQLTHPVDFMSGIEYLYETGVRTFVEVGPKRVLTGLVRSILGDRDYQVLALDSSTGKKFGMMDLGEGLCRLASIGYPVDLSAWESAAPEPRKQRMRIPILGSNYRNPDDQNQQTRHSEFGRRPSGPPPAQTIESTSRAHKSRATETLKPGDIADTGPLPAGPKKITELKRKAMSNNKQSILEAFHVVQEGLKSMQSLQKETAETHRKFLETQSEASRTLQMMMERTQHLAEAAFGLDRSSTPDIKIAAQEYSKPNSTESEFLARPKTASHEIQSAPVIRQGQADPASLPIGSDFQKDAPASTPHADRPAGTVETTLNVEDQNAITGQILEVVSHLTGYPIEMLGLDMDIESDLGIDSIKRVEILSTLEERMPNLPTIPPDMMGTLKTLGQIADFLVPEIELISRPKRKPVPEEKTNLAQVQRRLVTIKELPSSTDPIFTAPEGRKFYVIDDSTGLSEAVAAELRKADIDAVCIAIEDLIQTETLADACGLVIPYLPQRPDWLKEALGIARQAAPALLNSAKKGAAIFAAITRMDGAFGLRKIGNADPLQGGLAALVKTAAIEWEGVNCRVLDIAPQWSDNQTVAQKAVKELLDSSASRPIEIGLDPKLPAGVRYCLDVESAPFPAGPLSISHQDVIVISGGARGVTAAAAQALAENAQPVLILLGRSPAPFPEPDWLQPLSDEASLKKAIRENELKHAQATPLELEKAYKHYMANREIARNLQKIKTLSPNVVYHSVDIRDGQALTEIINQVRMDQGPISGIIHGAGIVEDRLIVDKTPQQFDKVFATKVKGLQNLLDATQQDELKYLILFSSVAARRGNKGQADYAMANEVLNKMAQRESDQRPDCRVVAINWGPWEGGMISPALKREFNRNNIQLIPIEAGGRSLLKEMRGDQKGAVEVIIGADLTGESTRLTKTDQSFKETISSCAELSLTAQRELELEKHPILKSHILDNNPVVPFALISEWLGHSALHENPGLVLHGIDEIRLFQGIKLDQDKKQIRLMAGKIRKNGSNFEVDVEIRDGHAEGKELIHYGAKAILTENLQPAPVYSKPAHLQSNGYSRSIDDIYAKILFHGSQLQGLQEILHLSSYGMVAKIVAAPPPEVWMSKPFRSTWIGDPMVLDSAFQMATIWCYEQFGMVSLPSYAARYRQYQARFPSEGVTAVLEVSGATGNKMQGDFTFVDSDDKIVARMIGYKAVMDESLFKAFKPEINPHP